MAFSAAERQSMPLGTYREGEDACWMSNEIMTRVYGGVCDLAGQYKDEVGPNCPDKQGTCPFNQGGPEATFRFELVRLLSRIANALEDKKQ